MTIEELIEALQKAEGPSRELDWEIQQTLSPNEVFMLYGPRVDDWMTKVGDKMVGTWRVYGGAFSTSDRYCQQYTRYVDEALTLSQSFLPGWNLNFDATDGIANDVYLIGPDYRDDRPDENCSRPIGGKPIAIAICLATLSALKVKQEDGK